MNVTCYKSQNFRNLKNPELYPDESINVIFGENGQGKTNIIENIWMFTGCHSFRTHKCAELICAGQKKSSSELFFSAHGMNQTASLKIDSKREFTLNGIEREGPRRFLGEFQCVVFSPFSLSIVQNAPVERRKFLDIAISMVKPAYASHLIKYSKILANRNALLKQIAQGISSEEMLDPWDEELAKTGAKVTMYRLSYVDNLAQISGEIYKEISGNKEKMNMQYIQSSKSFAVDEYEMTENIYIALQKNRETDLRRLLTSVGPHKDDMLFSIDSMSSRNYGSQGQQKTCALSLKLGEAYIVKMMSGEYPVVLLDDVMSELDTSRQGFLLEYLKNWQVFITCCDAALFSKLDKYKEFKVENGFVVS